MREAMHLILLLLLLLLHGSRGGAAQDDPLPTSPTDPRFEYECSATSALEESNDGDLLFVDTMSRINQPQQQQQSSGSTEAVPCITIRTGWWFYELCWNRFLRQFHVEESKIVTEYYLGLGPLALVPGDVVMRRYSPYMEGDRPVLYQISAYRKHWSALKEVDTRPGDGQLHCNKWVDQRTQLLRHRQQPDVGSQQQTGRAEKRPHSSPTAVGRSPLHVKPQQPNNDAPAVAATAGSTPIITTTLRGGTLCDITGVPRRTLIVLTCERSKEGPVLFNVTEEQPCDYVVYVFGSAVCATLQKAGEGRHPRGGTTPEMRRTRDASKSDGPASDAAEGNAAYVKRRHQSSTDDDDGRIDSPTHYSRRDDGEGSSDPYASARAKAETSLEDALRKAASVSKPSSSTADTTKQTETSPPEGVCRADKAAGGSSPTCSPVPAKQHGDHPGTVGGDEQQEDPPEPYQGSMLLSLRP